jgi:hypothetical protein
VTDTRNIGITTVATSQVSFAVSEFLNVKLTRDNENKDGRLVI